MTKKRAKAKFRVGQVVCIRKTLQCFRIVRVVLGKGVPILYLFDDGSCASENAVRSLTKRERGKP